LAEVQRGHDLDVIEPTNWLAVHVKIISFWMLAVTVWM
jgi:hypothetical protein